MLSEKGKHCLGQPLWNRQNYDAGTAEPVA